MQKSWRRKVAEWLLEFVEEFGLPNDIGTSLLPFQTPTIFPPLPLPFLPLPPPSAPPPQRGRTRPPSSGLRHSLEHWVPAVVHVHRTDEWTSARPRQVGKPVDSVCAHELFARGQDMST